jgi:hypothetical protein
VRDDETANARCMKREGRGEAPRALRHVRSRRVQPRARIGVTWRSASPT